MRRELPKTFIQEKQANLAELSNLLGGATAAAFEATIETGFADSFVPAAPEEVEAAMRGVQCAAELRGAVLPGEQLRLVERSVLLAAAVFLGHHRRIFSKQQASELLELLNSNSGDSAVGGPLVGPGELLARACSGFSREQLGVFEKGLEAVFRTGCALAVHHSLSAIWLQLVGGLGLCLEASGTDSGFLEDLKAWRQADAYDSLLLAQLANFCAQRSGNSARPATGPLLRFVQFLAAYKSLLDRLGRALEPLLSVDSNPSTRRYFWQTDLPVEAAGLTTELLSCAFAASSDASLRCLIRDLAALPLFDPVRAQILAEERQTEFPKLQGDSPDAAVAFGLAVCQPFSALVTTLVSASSFAIHHKEILDLERPDNSRNIVSFKLGRGAEYLHRKVARLLDLHNNFELQTTYTRAVLPVHDVALTKALSAFLESCGQVARIPAVPKGVRDTDPAQMRILRRTLETISEIYSRHGVVEIDTPVFELKETLLGKYGEEAGKLIYDLIDQGEQMLSLRYDLSIPLARYLAKNNLKKIKRYQIGKVYRRDQPDSTKGVYREFYQCDLDFAGQYSPMTVDAEMLSIVEEVVAALDIGPHSITLGHSALLSGMLAISGVPRTKFLAVLATISKLEQSGWTEVRRELIELRGLDAQSADRLGASATVKGELDAVLGRLEQEQLFLGHQQSLEAIADLKLLSKYLKCFDAYRNVALDLSLVRGAQHYNGIFFEVLVRADTPTPVGGGGRCDQLLGMFSRDPVPCVSFSLGVERVCALLEAKLLRNATKVRDSDTQFLVATVGPQLFENKLALLKRLWKAGFKAEGCFELAPKPGKQQAQAYSARIPFILWLGPEEAEVAVVKVKCTYSKIEESLPLDERFEQSLTQKLEQYRRDLAESKVVYSDKRSGLGTESEGLRCCGVVTNASPKG